MLEEKNSISYQNSVNAQGRQNGMDLGAQTYQIVLTEKNGMCLVSLVSVHINFIGMEHIAKKRFNAQEVNIEI